MDPHTINETRDQLNELISSNDFPAAIKKIEEVNVDLKSINLENKVLNFKRRLERLQQSKIEGIETTQSLNQEEDKLWKAFTELKDWTLNVLEHGETEILDDKPSPVKAVEDTVALNPKITIVDYAIVGLVCLVFLVLLVAFSFALFTNPVKVGLIAFASAVMMGIILYLRKYKRDMGTGVFQTVRRN